LGNRYTLSTYASPLLLPLPLPVLITNTDTFQTETQNFSPCPTRRVDKLQAEAQGFSPANKDLAEGDTALPEAGVKSTRSIAFAVVVAIAFVYTPFPPPKLFFTLLLSKIACQAPKPTKTPITNAPSTR
jgi:hypothetical protein